MANSAFNLTGATPMNPGLYGGGSVSIAGQSAPKPATSTGVLSGSSSNSGAISLGSSSGIGPFASTTSTNGKGGQTTKPTPNPSVLAQQKALNKLGAGLVEDGLAGPQTQAAIAKYGSQASTSTASTPTTKPDAATLQGNTDKNNLNNYGTQPTTPGVLPVPGSQQNNNLTVDPNSGVNANNSINASTYQAPNQGTQGVSQGGLIGNLNQLATTPSPLVQQYNDMAQGVIKAQAAANKNIDSSGVDTSLATGQEAILNRNYAAQLQAAQTGVQNALSQQGQQITAGTNAANANAPIQQPYSNMLINPATGQPYQQNQAGGTLESAVQGVVQKLNAGTMSYNDALNALSGYGQGGVNALQKALPPGFNIAQSNTLAGQQGAIKPALEYAQSALTNLQNSVSNLGTGQNTNIPIINQITQGLSTTFGVGSQAVQAYKGALAEARSAIQKVLASVQGGTPTDYVGQSNALLPDNATPNQIAAAAQTLNTLGASKANIYGNPGQAGGTQTSGSTTGGSIWSW